MGKKSTRYRLRRVADAGGEYIMDGLSQRELGQQVAWCATDNLGMARSDARERATEAEAVLIRGDTYRLGSYTFTATVEE